MEDTTLSEVYKILKKKTSKFDKFTEMIALGIHKDLALALVGRKDLFKEFDEMIKEIK